MATSERYTFAQWQLLRQLEAKARSQGELASILGRRSQAVSDSLGRLEVKGWVERLREGGHSAPNTPARLWALTPLGRARADDGPPPGGSDDEAPSADLKLSVSPPQTFVAVTVRSGDLGVLMDVVAEGLTTAEASAVVRYHGDGQGYVFLFDSRLGARPTEALTLALNNVGIACFSGVVGQVRALSDFVRDARASQAGRDGEHGR